MYIRSLHVMFVWTVLLVMDLMNDFEYSSSYWLLDR